MSTPGNRDVAPAEPRIALGETLELPWWVFALGIPPVAVMVLALVLGAPLWGRVLAVVSSLAVLVGMARIAQRVESRSMQSVWVSLAMAVWFFCAVTWVAAVMSR